jgi:hypothetical protein
MMGRARRSGVAAIEPMPSATAQTPVNVVQASSAQDGVKQSAEAQDVKRISYPQDQRTEESVKQTPTTVPAAVDSAKPAIEATGATSSTISALPNAAAEFVAPPAPAFAGGVSSMRIEPSWAGPTAGIAARGTDDVIDLPGDASDAAGILSAILHRPEWGLAECPVSPPMCPSARLAVSRDRGLTLVAVATRGLSELRSIGLAYRWMLENRSLIAMALPQFAIDASRAPALHLLVDQADISADLLRPIVQVEHVNVRAYRALRWAGRTGLLLDAA